MPPLNLLLFIGAEGVYHDHLGQGKYLAKVLNTDAAIRATLSRDYEVLAGGLDAFDATLFYTDVGTLTEAQEDGLLRFIEAGGGFFGLHTAAASFRDRRSYHAMLNGFFDGHSPYMDFTVRVVDGEHPITRGLEDFSVTDELYYLKHDPSHAHRLLEARDPTRDETHVTAFTREHGGGRVFYFALGHDMAVLTNPTFQEILRRGVIWTGRRSE